MLLKRKWCVTAKLEYMFTLVCLCVGMCTCPWKSNSAYWRASCWCSQAHLFEVNPAIPLKTETERRNKKGKTSIVQHLQTTGPQCSNHKACPYMPGLIGTCIVHVVSTFSLHISQKYSDLVALIWHLSPALCSLSFLKKIVLVCVSHLLFYVCTLMVECTYVSHIG